MASKILLLGVCMGVLLGGSESFLVRSPPRSLTSSSVELCSTKAATLPPPVKRQDTLKEEILSLIAVPDGDENIEIQRMARVKRMEFLLTELAKGFVPAQTVQFANLAVQGAWTHQFSSWRGRPQDPEAQTVVALREVVQSMSPNLTTGQILTQVYWRAITKGEEPLDGRFEVSSRYMMNSKGVLEVSLEEQALYPNRAPADPQGLLKGLQRICPIDVWDPEETFMETTFLDHEMRVVQTHCTRFGTISNLFIRSNSKAAEYLKSLRAT